MRPFYVKGRVDDRKTMLTGGPRRKDGGMDFTFYIKEEEQGYSQSVEELTVRCYCSSLCRHMLVLDRNGDIIYKVDVPVEPGVEVMRHFDDDWSMESK